MVSEGTNGEGYTDGLGAGGVDVNNSNITNRSNSQSIG